MGQLMHCTKPGLFPFESDCQHFYRCKDEEGPLVNLANGIYQRGEIHELTLSSHACLQFNRCEFFFFSFIQLSSSAAHKATHLTQPLANASGKNCYHHAKLKKRN
jgi:hypothetical protein